MQNSYTTARLTLNELASSDADFIAELVNTPEWIRFIGERNVRTSDDAVRYVQKVIDDPNLHYWVVKLRDEAVPIGIITLIQRDYLTHPDLGFAFLSRHGKTGYAYEAASAVLMDVMADAAQSQVLATTTKENTNSIRLLEKLGFRFERQIRHENEVLLLYSTGTVERGISLL